MKTVKNYEDLMAPCLKFVNLLKQKSSVESARTQEGVSYFKFNEATAYFVKEVFMDVEGSFNTRWGKLSAVLSNKSNHFQKQ